MSARLATSVLVGGLVRKAETEGGFAAVLAKGDPTAGSLIVVLIERGTAQLILERILQPDGTYKWHSVGAQPTEDITKNNDVPAFVARRRRFDPDLWVLELDIPSAERFAAEMNSDG
ncbi:MAG: DUF1491 family protein [Allosphingosinicella sp.]